MCQEKTYPHTHRPRHVWSTALSMQYFLHQVKLCVSHVGPHTKTPLDLKHAMIKGLNEIPRKLLRTERFALSFLSHSWACRLLWPRATVFAETVERFVTSGCKSHPWFFCSLKEKCSSPLMALSFEEKKMQVQRNPCTDEAVITTPWA